MALSKAAGVIHTRTLLLSRGESAMAGFLGQLTSPEAELFQKILPVGKLPIETAMKFYELAVPLLYPDLGLDEGLQRLAYETAQNDMRGVYRILLRLATPEFAVRQTAKIWKTYHDAGEASTEALGPKKISLSVVGYPDLPPNFLHVVTGYSLGVMELVGARQPRIESRAGNPQRWEWIVSWE